MTTDQFAAFPNAPTPKTLADAQVLIETTVRLIGKEGGRPANLPRPETLVDALDHLEAQRQVLADLLREKSTQTSCVRDASEVDAARAELSREAEANRQLQEELKALRAELEDDAEARASYAAQIETLEEMHDVELLGRQTAEHVRDTYRTVIERMLVASLYVGGDERIRSLGKSIGATVKARAGGDDEVVWTDDDIA